MVIFLIIYLHVYLVTTFRDKSWNGAVSISIIMSHVIKRLLCILKWCNIWKGFLKMQKWRKFFTGLSNQWILFNDMMNREDPGQTVWMHRLIWPFAVCTWPFSHVVQWMSRYTITGTFWKKQKHFYLSLLWSIKKDVNAGVISPDKALFFQLKSTDIFLIFPQKHMLWVLIRSASVRRF